MYLTIGITLPDDLRDALLALQNHFQDKSWEPASFLFLPLCTLGEVTQPLTLEELDHALHGLRLKEPASFVPDGFDVFTRRDRITLELRVRSPSLDHLSVKSLSAAKRAGVRNAHICAPLSIPLATISAVPPEDVSAWIQLHHQTVFTTSSISEITLFRSWKNRETTLFTPEANYLFAPPGSFV